jgi:hypothetical protein
VGRLVEQSLDFCTECRKATAMKREAKKDLVDGALTPPAEGGVSRA